MESHAPRTMPCDVSACAVYSEHEGVYRQLAGRIGDTIRWYARMIRTSARVAACGPLGIDAETGLEEAIEVCINRVSWPPEVASSNPLQPVGSETCFRAAASAAFTSA